MLEGRIKGSKNVVGKEKIREKGDSRTDEERKNFVENLNSFYCRLYTHDFSQERGQICKDLKKTAESKMALEVSVEEVEMALKKGEPKKGYGSRFNKWTDHKDKELAPVYNQIFNLSVGRLPPSDLFCSKEITTTVLE